MFRNSVALGSFAAYLLFNSFPGLWVTRRQTPNAKDCFLAGDPLLVRIGRVSAFVILVPVTRLLCGIG